jgi:AcrR family transcriptional regulator
MPRKPPPPELPKRKRDAPPPSELPKRKRRDPEEARRIILDAAERLFAREVPDRVGLKDVAREASVSHALVSHYFGSYEALVEETLARAMTRAREAVLAILFTEEQPPARLLEQLARTAEDPLLLRLLAWALLTGRTRSAEFLSARVQGLRRVADAMATRREAAGLPAVPRDDIEFMMMAGITMVLGFGIAKEALLAGFGRPATGAALHRAEADYRARVLEMIQGYLARRTGAAAPPFAGA